MGASYFIVLDNDQPGFDPFVNGKSIARDAKGLTKVCKQLSIRSPEEYISISSDDFESMADGLDVDITDDVGSPAGKWFTPDEGLAWIIKLRSHIQANPNVMKNPSGVLSDLNEYEQVFTKARQVGAKWHFSIDF